MKQSDTILTFYLVGQLGCIAFHKLEGSIPEPEIVRQFTKDTLEENDLLSQWLKDNCDIISTEKYEKMTKQGKINNRTSVDNLYDNFFIWLQDNECHFTYNKLKFSKEMELRFKRIQPGSKYEFERITIKPDTTERV